METIAEVFNEVQESTSVSQKQVYALLEQYETNKAVFLKATEQCYLKIIKSLLKAPRKLIEKYEKLTEKLFETGYRQYALKEDQSSKKQKLTKRDIFQLFQHFLAFFAGALDSTQLQIRIFSSRIIFQLLKILPSDTLVDIIEVKVAKQLILGTLSLMKEKKGNLKHIGIKITSYLQKLMDRDDLTETQEAKILRSEMMKSMCMDDQDQIRKLALINLEMNESTFPHLIKRIRDKNPEIRATVFKKLIKEQIPLANLNLSDIYKLIYDGLGSRESSVREACIRYLQLNYNLFKEDEENPQKNQIEEEMELEENKEKDGEKEESSEDNEIDEEKTKKKQSKSAIKRFFTPNKETAMKDLKIKILNFLKTFEIEKSLYYPELYESLELLVKETIKQILDADSFSAYLKDCFLNQLSLKKKKKHTQISIEGEELFLIRVLCQMVQNQDDRKELSPELVAVVEDCFPNGVDFSQVIDYYSFTQPNLFSLYQVLLLAELLINCDESGRNKIEETLKNLVINMSNTNLISEIPTDPSNEYNDIFYYLEPDTVMNNIFSQSYFFSPIITCSYELLPIIVRILKKIVSDGRVNVQLIQLISEVHEPLAKDTDNDSHFDLPSELERIRNSINEEKKKLDNIEKELSNLKKNKTKQNEIYQLEKEKDEKQAHLKIWEEKEDAIQSKIFDISMRELVLVQSLLTYCKVDPKDPAISNLLQQIILPGLHSSDRSLNFNSLKSLALYVLIDKKNCIDFFSVFSDILDKSENCQNCTPQEIISLRSIVDFLLLYDLTQKQSQDDEDIDIPQTQDLILKYAYQADILLRTISIEGLSKLLFNGKLQDPHTTICLLLVIWFDTKICTKQGFKAIQILSTLFKTFTASNYYNLQIFEKALELFSQLMVTLEKKGLVFNDEYVIFDHSNEKFISKALRVGINLMSYEYHNNTEVLKNVSSNEFLPQERFFLFLAYKCSKERRFQSLFEKITQYFDFYNKCTTEQLQIILHFLKEAIENCPVSKQFNQLEKVIKDKIKIQDKNERQEEDEEKEELNKVLGKEKSDKEEANDAENGENGLKNDEDQKLYTLNAKQLKICDKIIELFEGNQQDIEVIVKNLFSNGTLINDSAEQKKKRAMMYDEEDEERANNEEDDDNEKEEKPKRGRPAKRKSIHPNSDDEEEGEDDDEQEEGAQEETKRRGRPKKDISEASHAPSQRGRKKKAIYIDQEEEEDNEEEEEQENKDSKKNSATRKAKNAKELEDILNQETEEDEDDEDREEVINKRTSSRRAQKTVLPESNVAQKTSKRGRKKKDVQDEVIEQDEEDDEQEEEDMSAEQDIEEEDKKNKKQVGRRGRKPASTKSMGSSSEKESPKTNRRGRRSASKENKISEESDEEHKETDNEDQEEELSQKKTRGRGRPKKSNEKTQSQEEEEGQDNSQSDEQEEEVEEEEAPRKTRGSSKKSTPAQKKSKTRSSQKSVDNEESGEDEEQEEQKPQKKGRGRPKAQPKEPESEQDEQNESEQEQENESEQEEEEDDKQTKRRGRKPKNVTQAVKRTTRHNSANKNSDKEESEGEEENEEEEQEEDEEEQTRVTRKRGRKQADTKKPTKNESVRSTRRGGSRNKMEEEHEDEEENESSEQEHEEQEEEEEEQEQTKTRGRPKKSPANKSQAKETRGRGRKKNEKQQSDSQSEDEGEEEEDEEDQQANQRTTRRQKQQIETSKKPVSSSQRLRRRK
ncbi:AT hook motif protein (macronuclear) [Tetrahymena thermophila SB210]|uniref:AT hook motif protein n=1 Tax=Tetrahymena thermophila (strain SB210) TaxID=312017 RepID=Q24IK5_TETTS|nr:AT hook motif protein [Tetrahymena thermophila SB210]EAS07620.2 AT hook motif protein [Tetrahymena thermophila SB210]|eukprot:XP_001027862.2 AT hook motif protein [Tetrahymena thermophila SB210]